MKLRMICCLLLAGSAARAADSRIATILNDLASTRHFADIAISPDGKRIAWVEEPLENGIEKGEAAIWIKDIASPAAPLRIGTGEEPTWSPDGTKLAFLSNRESKQQTQLYVIAAPNGRTKQLTRLTGYMTSPAWSPDGTHIAILFAENAAAGGGPLEAEPIETGVIGGEIHNQRLTIIDGNSGASKQISPADQHIYEYDWSPDSKTFVALAAPGPGDNNWWVAKLYTIPVASGQMTEIFKPETQIAMPRWSPDGSSIAFIQGLMSDAGFNGGDIYTIPATGGKAVNRTSDRNRSASSLTWLSPTNIWFTEIRGGGSAISFLSTKSDAIEGLWQGDEDLHIGGNFPNLAFSRDGKTAAMIRADWQRPPEVWAGTIGNWKKISNANAAHRPPWGEAKSVEWRSDNFEAQGWLLYPVQFDPSKRYPMVVSIHGGPANYNYPRWPKAGFDLSVLSSLGYFVFFPNPRGSYGQGEAFTRANVKDFGAGDLRDVLAGVDAVLKTAPVDPNRIGVGGWSYGGYMTMWTVTQTNRFKAAVAGAGIANWQSYYGENAIDQWMIPYFGASVYDDPKAYEKSSPIAYIKHVKTPTLVVVGERDGECPMPQSYEFWHALRTLGVPTELVVYPGEGHMFRQADHKRDVLERTAAWFEKYLR